MASKKDLLTYQKNCRPDPADGPRHPTLGQRLLKKLFSNYHPAKIF
jgi:hypothetical protein